MGKCPEISRGGNPDIFHSSTPPDERDERSKDREPAAKQSADPVPNKTGTRIPRALIGEEALCMGR